MKKLKKVTNSGVTMIVGGSGKTTPPSSSDVIPLSKIHLLILQLAYAYTNLKLDELNLGALSDLYDLSATVAINTANIADLSNRISLLSNIDNEEFIEQVNKLVDKIDDIDPDVITELSYTYTYNYFTLATSYSYSYSYNLYTDSLEQSYNYTDVSIEDLKNEINSRIDQFINTNNDLITKTEAYETFAYKSDIPVNVSQLNNDSLFVTQEALSTYAPKSYIDERFEHLIGTAPEALDTLEEISAYISTYADIANSLVSQLEQKADKSTVDSLINNAIVKANGIPIYTVDKINELNDEGIELDEYIEVPSSDELYATSESGRYLDIIMQTLKSLQMEVTKIKNTFEYGLCSKTNTDTRMSVVVNDEYDSTKEEEPVWATDPEILSEIPGTEMFLDNSHILRPINNIIVGQDKLTVVNEATWNDNYFNETTGKYNNYLKDSDDPKQYIYLTTSSTNITFTLKELTDNEQDANIINLNLESLNITNTAAEKFNILLCVSRSYKHNNSFYGNNFIYVSIGDYLSGNNLVEKYYDMYNDRFTEAYTILGAENNKNRYYVSSITFRNLDIYSIKFYSKFQDFSNGVDDKDLMPSAPTDEDYKYDVAHITIRSVKSKDMLDSIKDQLLENELIYNTGDNCIYIKTDNKIKRISGGSYNGDGSDTDYEGMDKEELIELLESNGIIVTEDGSDNLILNKVGDITFVNEAGDKFRYSADSNGELKFVKLNSKTLQDRMNIVEMTVDDTYVVNSTKYENVRGFVGTLGGIESGKLNATQDLKLKSDRVKIANVYAPFKTNKTYGCTHGYIELENTSNEDFALDNCQLHFARKYEDPLGTVSEGGKTYKVDEYCLELDGKIPAGSTYLVRCKKYSDISQANTFIDVKTFDKEWFEDGELLDLYLGDENTFMLTYGLHYNKRSNEANKFSWKTKMWGDVESGSNAGYKSYNPHFIDAFSIMGQISDKSGSSPLKTWDNGATWYKNAKKLDALYKNTFELDPAKQAYQGLCATSDAKTIVDSSRLRNDKAQDLQTVYLQKEYIEFPKSDEKFPISYYTPKSSIEQKNVCTDKTQFDVNKPNMVTVAFGIDMNKTRCFNWVSGGSFDEYVWIRQKGSENWTSRFESYKTITSDKAQSSSYPRRKEFSVLTNNTVYARIENTFPGSGIKYTAHKCIIDVVNDYVTSKTEYEYIVGRADKNGNPDAEHTSDIMRFTLYPNTYTPRIFQTSDQQGFHWIEYQVWNAAANVLEERIDAQVDAENIIPVLVNTGDMTQNGTRINEWLDYYNGGYNLFNHLEQMNVVGNNDLCGTDVTALGTGDDDGKSNGYYFHVFYCYEVSEDKDTNNNYKYLPIIPSSGDNPTYKYVPSFYWFGNSEYCIIMMNSEITVVNCSNWFNRNNTYIGTDNKPYNVPINIYTGWEVKENGAVYDNGFTTIYTMLYNVLNTYSARKIIIGCHEMPFTVITKENLTDTVNGDTHTILNKDRSLSGTKNSLVGCHMNKLNATDVKSNYWFSRLIEYFNIKFVFGGHKHTYAITNKIRENYLYKKQNDDKWYWSGNGRMNMSNTLENDNISFTIPAIVDSSNLFKCPITSSGMSETAVNGYSITFHGSKFPILYYDGTNTIDKNLFKEGFGIEYNVYNDGGGKMYPYYGINDKTKIDSNTVIYSMCQATGYKLKSNKELPANYQKFSFIIPKTADSGSSPAGEQQHPIFNEIRFSRANNQYKLESTVYAIYDIMVDTGDSPSYKFEQTAYSNNPVSVHYIVRKTADELTSDEDYLTIIYGKWNELANITDIAANHTVSITL